jgi:hypothetical protein
MVWWGEFGEDVLLQYSTLRLYDTPLANTKV